MTPKEKWLFDYLLDDSQPTGNRIMVMVAASRNPDASLEQLQEVSTRGDEAFDAGREITEMGHFGNIWYRLQYYAVKDFPTKGHKHVVDHITVLFHGGLLAFVEDEEPREYWAAKHGKGKPTVIEIPADKWHYFVPLTDHTSGYCMYAILDEDGNPTTEFNGDVSNFRSLPRD